MPGNVERLLEHFRNEFSAAAHAYFVWKGIHNSASEDRAIQRGLNEQALTWNTITYALQTTFFIALHRLFDTDGDAFSVHLFLRQCTKNIDEFGKDGLRARKIALSNGKEPDWLAGYLAEAYVPSTRDFQKLRGEVRPRYALYREIYQPIRHRIYAHKDAAAMENVDALFGHTKIDQIEELLSFLYQIQEVVSQLLWNGRMTEIGEFKFSEEELVVEDVRELLNRLRIPALENE